MHRSIARRPLTPIARTAPVARRAIQQGVRRVDPVDRREFRALRNTWEDNINYSLAPPRPLEGMEPCSPFVIEPEVRRQEDRVSRAALVSLHRVIHFGARAPGTCVSRPIQHFFIDPTALRLVTWTRSPVSRDESGHDEADIHLLDLVEEEAVHGAAIEQRGAIRFA